MKKYNLWILILFMFLTFVGLVTLLVKNTIGVRSMLNEQFVDAVQRSLFRTVIEIEEREVRLYLDTVLSAAKPFDTDLHLAEKSHSMKANLFLSGGDSLLMRTDGLVTSSRMVNSSIEEVAKVQTEKYKERFLRSRSLLDIVTTRLINEAPERLIEERVDLTTLHSTIKSQLYNDGIELPFHCSIVDKYNNIIYSQNNETIDFARYSYKQKLFPSIRSEKDYFLYVYFYNEKDYYTASTSMLLPFVMLALLMLLTFILTIYYIFRQRKLNEIKNDFVNNMTHELKTPVSSISLASQMLNDPSVGKSPQLLMHVSKVIKEETKRLSYQVDKVLQMSVFEREKTIISQREVNVNEMIETIVTNFSLKVGSSGGSVSSNLRALYCDVYADEMHLGNVVYNLMDNAVKYSRNDVPLILNIETWNKDKRLYISIEDNGIGIKKEYQKHLFDKFYRVPTGNRHDVKGFGLGLSYVQKIVLLHKGRIKVESELNVGTKFIIDLPLVDDNETISRK